MRKNVIIFVVIKIIYILLSAVEKLIPAFLLKSTCPHWMLPLWEMVNPGRFFVTTERDFLGASRFAGKIDIEQIINAAEFWE